MSLSWRDQIQGPAVHRRYWGLGCNCVPPADSPSPWDWENDPRLQAPPPPPAKPAPPGPPKPAPPQGPPHSCSTAWCSAWCCTQRLHTGGVGAAGQWCGGRSTFCSTSKRSTSPAHVQSSSSCSSTSGYSGSSGSSTGSTSGCTSGSSGSSGDSVQFGQANDGD